jgi:hypothetical protein
MLQWRSATQLLSYLLGGIGVLATEVGYAGLAVLIDEAEFCQVVAARVRSDAERTARALLASALPEAAAGDLARGGTKRLADVPYRFRPAQHVAAFVTMTPEEGSGVPVAATTAPPAMPVTGHTGDASDPSAGMGMLHLTRIVASQGGAVTDVEPLSRGDLLDLCDRVISLARAARIPGATRPDLHERVRSHVDAAIAQGRRVTPRQVVRLAALLPDVPGPAAQLARSSR